MKKAINIKTACKLYEALHGAEKARRYYFRTASELGFSADEELAQKYTAQVKQLQEELNAESSRLLGAELDAVQARAKVRTVTPCEIVEALHDLQKHLDIPKKALEGVKVHFDLNAQAFPSAYKYTPESTHVSAEFKGGSWRITNISREECRRPSFKFTVTHTDASRAALLQRFTAIEEV